MSIIIDKDAEAQRGNAASDIELVKGRIMILKKTKQNLGFKPFFSVVLFYSISRASRSEGLARNKHSVLAK